jgi:pimeloyl-ACP methyl ester carboxylesterase
MNKKKLLLGIGVILLIGIGGFLIWGYTPPRPMPEAIAALESDAQIQVTTGTTIEFTPKASTPEKGIIIYPGGRVDPRSYAPTARALALAGYVVVIASMPVNLAVFQPNKAGGIIENHPGINVWAVGGHSLGGVMAAQFASKNPTAVQGLFFWASYPAGDISSLTIPVLSISASLDGLTTPEKIEETKALLPAGTTYIQIEGGNHAQFGWYGDQTGDNQATISRSQQQTEIVANMILFMNAL